MPIEFKILENDKIMYMTWKGDITKTVLLDFYKNIFRKNIWIPHYDELININEANLIGLNKFIITDFKDLVKEYLNKYNFKKKVAIYAPQNYKYGISRIYSVLMEDLQIIQVYKTFEDAKRWLEIESTTLPQIKDELLIYNSVEKSHF